MSDTLNAIKEAIEHKVGHGDWHGIKVEDGRYEGNLDTLDINLDSIEVKEVDLDQGVVTITAEGLASATHKDADSNEISREYDVRVTANISIRIGDASITGVDN